MNDWAMFQYCRYMFGFLDILLKWMMIADMNRILGLPVKIDSLRFSLGWADYLDKECSLSEKESSHLTKNKQLSDSSSWSFILQIYWAIFITLTDNLLPTVYATVDIKGIFKLLFMLLIIVVLLSGLQVQSPPLDVDNRWDSDYIIDVSEISVRFPFLKSLFLYTLSFTEVLSDF